MKQTFSLRRPVKHACGITVLRYLIILGAGLFCSGIAQGQNSFENTAPLKYRIGFTDKLNSVYSTDNPAGFLSARAMERRQKQGIAVTENDLPVNRAYIDSLVSAGARVLNVSRWLNSATVQISDDSVLDRIASLSFVVKDPSHERIEAGMESAFRQENTLSAHLITELDYGPSWWQTAIHNGHLLHSNGYTGKGIVIAVIDAGFLNADTLSVFNRLFEEGRILGTRDFVEPGNDVFREASHGMSVLSIIGGYQPGALIGTGPDASFWLLRSEDSGSEYIIEEDNWIAAAEFADSAGADIINTSLGYSEFNDSLQNHSYSDMDGNTTRVSRAADIAASKGMMVIISAGNQGNAAWKYITAPADADSVLTIGAVDRSGTIASFSSRGPSSDNQVKPNVVAPGQGVFVTSLDGSVRPGNGTSFSAPVITGLTACLWQANRQAKASDIFRAICESADRFYNPDNDYGYGLPDFNLANVLLKAGDMEPEDQVTAFPNPFYNQLYLFFKTPVSKPIDISLFDLAGKEVFCKTYPAVSEREYLVIDSEFDNLQKGIYIIRIKSGNITGNSKLIKY